MLITTTILEHSNDEYIENDLLRSIPSHKETHHDNQSFGLNNHMPSQPSSYNIASTAEPER